MMALLALAACRIHDTFSCTLDEQCAPGGRCEPVGSCSFPDSACAGGWRYDDYADGDRAGQCVTVDGCPASYTATVPGLTSRYRPVGQLTPWLAAQNDCADDGAGTHLVVIGSNAERLGVQALIDDDAWIGLSDRVTEGSFRWVTGAALSYTAWGIGQPGDTDGSQDCAYQKHKTQDWHDHACEELLLYLCECDGVASDPATY